MPSEQPTQFRPPRLIPALFPTRDTKVSVDTIVQWFYSLTSGLIEAVPEVREIGPGKLSL
jgi:hypothetical protein